MRMRGDTIATLSVCRLRGRGFDSRIGTFFFTPFFFSPFFLSHFFPLSFSFMLAPPLQCSSIFLVKANYQIMNRWLITFEIACDAYVRATSMVSKIIAFTVSAKFDPQDCWQGESLAWPALAGQVSLSS